ncbi:hypothetical protein EAI_08031 [Harpegnathos saltator]|uniref:Uncharacterized protein n=1 Tax=Harpegnathos saltator TaxID=610380 RepID=E2BSX9_HARSA|nr:hypothetical protein EAI_08031 [Harpegnathos saltator]
MYENYISELKMRPTRFEENQELLKQLAIFRYRRPTYTPPPPPSPPPPPPPPPPPRRSSEISEPFPRSSNRIAPIRMRRIFGPNDIAARRPAGSPGKPEEDRKGAQVPVSVALGQETWPVPRRGSLSSNLPSEFEKNAIQAWKTQYDGLKGYLVEESVQNLFLAFLGSLSSNLLFEFGKNGIQHVRHNMIVT